MAESQDDDRENPLPELVAGKPRLRGNEPLFDIKLKKKRIPTTHDVVEGGQIIGTSADENERETIRLEYQTAPKKK